MTMRAQVLDHTPDSFRRALDRRRRPAGEVQAPALLEDVTDGILALDFALSFAGFSYEARQLTLSVAGLIGGGGGRLEKYDKELAGHVNCSDRTIRRWRAAHVKETKAKKFSLLYIEEGEYTGRKRYEKTAHSLNPAVAPYLDAVVAEARASDLYESDRREAFERAAEEHYHEIPDAPPRMRRRKPRREPSVKVAQAFLNAARSVEKGRQALQDLSEDSQSALLEGPQGEGPRQTLLKLQADIGEILESLPQPAEAREVGRGLGHFVLTLSDEPDTEDVAAWEEVERRAAGSPLVVTQDLIFSPPPSEEELEAEAIRAEGCRKL